MTYQEIYDEVVSLTRKPELDAETRIAIQAVTSNHHARDTFKGDHVDDFVIFQESANIQEFLISGMVRWRAFSYIRRWDIDTSLAEGGTAGPFFTPVPPDKILDSYNLTTDYTYYQTGDSIKLRSETAFQYLLIGYYKNARVSPVSEYQSWIAERYPYLIIFDAAQRVLTMSGNVEAAKGIEALKAESSSIVQINNSEIQMR
jgi:hypothetical protein